MSPVLYKTYARLRLWLSGEYCLKHRCPKEYDYYRSIYHREWRCRLCANAAHRAKDIKEIDSYFSWLKLWQIAEAPAPIRHPKWGWQNSGYLGMPSSHRASLLFPADCALPAAAPERAEATNDSR